MWVAMVVETAPTLLRLGYGQILDEWMRSINQQLYRCYWKFFELFGLEEKVVDRMSLNFP